MGWLAAALFRRVQGAGFYEDLHRRAVSLLPPGQGAHWLDVGCGPGLLARLAVARGYTVTAVDRDPAMIVAAERTPRNHADGLSFRVSSLEMLTVSRLRGAVVSAGSLLAVMDDRRQGLGNLLTLLHPGGTLLLVEPTAEMTLRRAWRWLHRQGLRRMRGRGWLLLWAATRQPGRAVDHAGLMQALPEGGDWQVTGTPLLGGMVTAWQISAGGEP